MAHPQFTDYENNTRHAFQAMMWALSYPGRSFPLLTDERDDFAHIADSLLDLETSFYCEDEVLIPSLLHTGARQLPSDRAAYHFYPSLDDSQLDSLQTASIGTLTYPDQAATLFIGCTHGQGIKLNLEGPGIPASEYEAIQIEGLSFAFWEIRENAIRYPRGWDIFLVDRGAIIGLPRTTRILIEE